MYKIAYFGYSEKMLQILIESETFELAFVIGTKGRISEKYYDLIHQYNIRYIEISDKKELLSNINLIENTDITIMYKFEFIIPDEIVEKHLIINFHGGELSHNRGAHAVVWSILLQEPKTCLSCYRLSGGIDEGYLIDTYYVDIEQNDNVLAVNEKLAKGIPQMLNSIEKYLSGERKTKLVRGGNYRRKIKKQDYTIDLYHDSISSIRAKILSQQSYDGAVLVVNENEYRIKKFDIIEKDSADNLRISMDSKSVDICCDGIRMCMYFEN